MADQAAGQAKSQGVAMQHPRRLARKSKPSVAQPEDRWLGVEAEFSAERTELPQRDVGVFREDDALVQEVVDTAVVEELTDKLGARFDQDAR